MPAPEILHHVGKALAIVLYRLQLKRLTGRKRGITQSPLAEAMNGEGGGFVKTFSCQPQSGITMASDINRLRLYSRQMVTIVGCDFCLDRRSSQNG